MGKTIVLIHGRHFKPARTALRRLWVDALRAGLRRDHPNLIDRFDQARIEFVYYGHISNAFLSQVHRRAIPDDTASRRRTLNDLKTWKRDQFTKSTYESLPGMESAWETLADVFGPVLSLTRLSDWAIHQVAPDLREYWNFDSAFGSEVRATMIKPLQRAMNRNDRICVIAHSLGSLIAYDTFWKFCRTAEYRPKYTTRTVDLWITIGSPLGDETIKRNLKGARASGPRCYPANVRRWLNLAAEDDYICHDEKVADDYRDMLRHSLVDSIEDRRIYNLAVRDGTSNPHHEGGYLIHPAMADVLAEWL